MYRIGEIMEGMLLRVDWLTCDGKRLVEATSLSQLPETLSQVKWGAGKVMRIILIEDLNRRKPCDS